MDPVTMGIILGLGKNELIDRPRAEKKRQSQYITLKYSPWTGRDPGQFEQDPDAGAAMLQGAALGGMAKDAGWFGGAEKAASPAMMDATKAFVKNPVQSTINADIFGINSGLNKQNVAKSMFNNIALGNSSKDMRPYIDSFLGGNVGNTRSLYNQSLINYDEWTK